MSQFKGTATYIGGALRAIEEEGAEPLPVDLATRGGNFGAGPLCKLSQDMIDLSDGLYGQINMLQMVALCTKQKMVSL